MKFGLVTVARAAQVTAARATIESARHAGFTGTVHAVVLGLDVDPSALDPDAIDFLAVAHDPAAVRRLAPLGFAAMAGLVVADAILHALRTETTVVYLAPTIHVLAPLDDLATLADHRVALIERPRAGVPDDGLHPSEADLARAHRYSASIIAATQDARAWIERLRDTAWAELRDGAVPDLALLLDRVAHRFGVVTPPQPSRFVDWYDLGERALVTIDTDGYDRKHPHLLDARRPRPHRVTLSELPTLAAALASRPDASDVDDSPRLPNGLAFDRIMRDTYRAHLYEAVENQTEAPPDPYDEPAAFVDWLQASDFPGPSRLSRYLRQVYLSRPDLSRAFPEVPGRDLSRLYAWARDHGRHEIPIPADLLPSENEEPPARTMIRPRSAGVNLAGFVDDALGIGEVARRIGASLAEVATPYVTVPYRRGALSALDSPQNGARYDTNVVCINPDSLASFVAHTGDEFFANRYTIGVWFWETAVLPPAFGWAFDLVDEVWCASDFVVDAVAASAHDRAPVWKFPLAVVAPTVDPTVDRAHLGLPEDRFIFVMSFDYLSVIGRKNPIGAIQAFCRAFTVDEGAVLVVKSINGHLRLDDRARVRHAASGRSDIVMIDDQLAADANASLIATADCVVSLHRSEGFGFNLADAIALARPVIATAYGGNLEFMAELDEWLVPYTLVDVGEGQHPYPSDAQWAEPDLDAAATTMRSVFADPSRALERAERARADVTERFSLVRSGAALARRLGQLSDDPPKRERRGLRRR